MKDNQGRLTGGAHVRLVCKHPVPQLMGDELDHWRGTTARQGQSIRGPRHTRSRNPFWVANFFPGVPYMYSLGI